MSLVEVLIAFTVVAIAMFSVFSAMGTSHQTSRLAQGRDLAVSAIVRQIEDLQSMGLGPAFTTYRTPVTTKVPGLTSAAGDEAVLTVEINRLMPNGQPATTNVTATSVTIPYNPSNPSDTSGITYTTVRNGVTKTTTIPQTTITQNSTAIPFVISVTWASDGSLVSIRIPYTHINRS